MNRSSFIHHNELAPSKRKSRMLPGLLFCVLGAGLSLAQSAEDLRMTVGKSVVIDYPSDIRQISTSNPEVVDASPVTTREILMHGKGLGSATMVVWSKTGQRTFYNVTVDLNLDPLRRLLKESFPNEDIHVTTSRDAMVLDGHVSTKEVADRALALAAGFSKIVINNLQVASLPAEKQILLRVKFAEIDRQKEVQYGVNLLAAPGNNPIGVNSGSTAPSFTGTAIIPNGAATVSNGASTSAGTSAGSSSSTSTGSNGTFTISQALNLFAFDPKLNIGAFIQALESENILQVLAQPNLVTTNGKEAEFLVGGQFPVPILQGGASAGAVTVQFKNFGINLKFTPNTTDHGTIKLHLTQEVSTLDPSHGVTLNGFSIPALSTRQTNTDVELGEGQTFVVAGLLSDQDTYNLSKVPFLSSLPILGNLFKTKTDNKQKTELIMLVTPEITEPLGPNDPKPSLYFPKEFLKRLEPSDAPQSQKGKKNS
jgi:pilus assembly protein CpaC